MDADHVDACRFENWYPRFAAVTFKSRLVELTDDFIQYLKQDGVFLQEESDALPRRAGPDQYATEDDYRDWSDAEEDGLEGDEEGQVPSFPELQGRIQAAINELGGRVVPKLAWSCPVDAAWVNPRQSIMCTNADEVVLMLKSSDRVVHDLEHAYDSCASVPRDQGPQRRWFLALRKAYDLRPGREFRCFVRSHELVGVSQRDLSQHFPWLAVERESLLEAILEFFEQHIEHRFPLSSYTFDVYVATTGKVKLVDFNPVGGTTTPLLYTWEELGLAPLPLGTHDVALPPPPADDVLSAGSPDKAVQGARCTGTCGPATAPGGGVRPGKGVARPLAGPAPNQACDTLEGSEPKQATSGYLATALVRDHRVGSGFPQAASCEACVPSCGHVQRSGACARGPGDGTGDVHAPGPGNGTGDVHARGPGDGTGNVHARGPGGNTNDVHARGLNDGTGGACMPAGAPGHVAPLVTQVGPVANTECGDEPVEATDGGEAAPRGMPSLVPPQAGRRAEADVSEHERLNGSLGSVHEQRDPESFATPFPATWSEAGSKLDGEAGKAAGWEEVGGGVLRGRGERGAALREDAEGEGSENGGFEAIPLELRILEGVEGVQPNLARFGVPFDMVDGSQGSALDELVQKLQKEQHLQAEQ